MKNLPCVKYRINICLRTCNLMVFLLFLSAVSPAQDRMIRLDCENQAKLKPDNTLLKDSDPIRSDEKITLPGSLEENGYRIKMTEPILAVFPP